MEASDALTGDDLQAFEKATKLKAQAVAVFTKKKKGSSQQKDNEQKALKLFTEALEEIKKVKNKTKDIVYENYKGTMKCYYLQASLEIKNGKIIKFTTSRFNISNEYGEWRVDEEKSDPKKLFIHVKAINNISNSFDDFTYDFKYYLYNDLNHGNSEEKCEKKLEFQFECYNDKTYSYTTLTQNFYDQ